MSQATEKVQRLPWVRRMRKPRACDGIKWGTVACRDIFRWGPQSRNEPRGIQAKSRCSKSAWWCFRPLKKADLSWRYLQDGLRPQRYYCWSHLLSALGSMEEQERIVRWLRKNEEPIIR